MGVKEPGQGQIDEDGSNYHGASTDLDSHGHLHQPELGLPPSNLPTAHHQAQLMCRLLELLEVNMQPKVGEDIPQ